MADVTVKVMENTREKPTNDSDVTKISFRLGLVSEQIANLCNTLLDEASGSENIELLTLMVQEKLYLLNSIIVETLKIINKENKQ